MVAEVKHVKFHSVPRFSSSNLMKASADTFNTVA